MNHLCNVQRDLLDQMCPLNSELFKNSTNDDDT